MKKYPQVAREEERLDGHGHEHDAGWFEATDGATHMVVPLGATVLEAAADGGPPPWFYQAIIDGIPGGNREAARMLFRAISRAAQRGEK